MLVQVLFNGLLRLTQQIRLLVTVHTLGSSVGVF